MIAVPPHARTPRALAAAGLGVLVLAAGGCTAGGSSGPTPTSTSNAQNAATAPPSIAPFPRGRLTSQHAASCPLVGTEYVHQTMGIRLGRLNVLRLAGRVVGCRFYALQGGSLHASEHLPGPRQPAVEIVTQRYARATLAHNVFVRLAERGTNPQQARLAPGNVGVCFQNDFYAKDRGADWACAASVGATTVVVRTVDTTGPFNTITLAKRVLGGL